METEILRLHIRIMGVDSVCGETRAVNLVSFGGNAESELFRGEILPGAVDTQTVTPDGKTHLSARYMLAGTDSDGNPCRVFVENILCPGERTTTPVIVTDSPVLRKYESVPLVGYMENSPSELTIIVKVR